MSYRLCFLFTSCGYQVLWSLLVQEPVRGGREDYLEALHWLLFCLLGGHILLVGSKSLLSGKGLTSVFPRVELAGLFDKHHDDSRETGNNTNVHVRKSEFESGSIWVKSDILVCPC